MRTTRHTAGHTMMPVPVTGLATRASCPLVTLSDGHVYPSRPQARPRHRRRSRHRVQIACLHVNGHPGACARACALAGCRYARAAFCARQGLVALRALKHCNGAYATRFHARHRARRPAQHPTRRHHLRWRRHLCPHPRPHHPVQRGTAANSMRLVPTPAYPAPSVASLVHQEIVHLVYRVPWGAGIQFRGQRIVVCANPLYVRLADS